MLARPPRDEALLEAMETLERLFADPPERLDRLIRRIREAAAPAGVVASILRREVERDGGPSHWAEALERQVAEWGACIDRYLAWAEESLLYSARTYFCKNPD